MAKGLNKDIQIGLEFTADTNQAKQQIQDLQKSLTDLVTKSNINDGNLGFKKEISESIQLAAQLKVQLQNATDANTGKLNLVKFNQELINSNTTIAQYRDALMSLGPAGSQAFLSLSTAIMRADAPLINLNNKIKELGNTLANSIRWQISSSAIHGFMGAIQGAYGYAQDLNKSLTNISIVTGMSSENMADLAEQANKTAQSLSVSTLAYTDAALIYYQQGLDTKEVEERVATTLKMSNVTGESATQISSYMTAIWNNFRSGSESIESFADKITALGAATASSSEEIAKGLQHFASVADTVGLSYDYAASAVATIVAKTRQSADSVGNSLRTILARFSSLKLGETLEDGTELTKYTAALESVGVMVKDQNGEYRQMNDIIDDLGEKWQQLSRDQQLALASTVAGVKQYSNLVALLDDYDIFKENVTISENGEGTLQEQQERYEKSWEASQKRVKAAWQAIYSDLIDDKFFIKLSNDFAKILKLIDNFIDGIGGIKGVLISLVPIIANIFKNNLASGIDNATTALIQFTSVGRQAVEDRRLEASNALRDMFEGQTSTSGFAASTAMGTQAQVQEQYLANAAQMTDYQKRIAQLYLDQHSTLVQNVLSSKEEVDQAERILNIESRRQDYKLNNFKESVGLTDHAKNVLKESIQDEGVSKATIDQLNAERYKQDSDLVKEKTNGVYSNVNAVEQDLKTFREEATVLADLNALFDSFLAKKESLMKKGSDTDYDSEKIKEAQQNFIAFLETMDKSSESFGSCEIQVKELAASLGIAQEAEGKWVANGEADLEKYEELYNNLDATVTEKLEKFDQARSNLQKGGMISEADIAATDRLSASHQQLMTVTAQSALSANDFSNKLMNISGNVSTFAQTVSSAVRTISQVTSVLNGGMRIAEILSDKDLKPWEKFKQVLGVLTMMAPAFVGVTKTIHAIMAKNRAETLAATFAQEKLNEAQLKQKLIDAGIPEQIAAQVAKHILNTGAIGAETTATKGLTIAGIGLKAVFFEILIPLALIIAAGYGLVKVFESIKESTPEGRLAKLNEELDNAKEAAANASDAYVQASNSLQEYIDLKERLADLNEGEKVANIQDYNQDIRDRVFGAKDEDGNVLFNGLSSDELEAFGKLEFDENGAYKITEAQQKILDLHYKAEDSKQRQIVFETELAKIEEERAQILEKYDAKGKPQLRQENRDEQGNLIQDENGNYTTNVTEEAMLALHKNGINSLSVKDIENEDTRATIETILNNAGLDAPSIMGYFRTWGDKQFQDFNQLIQDYFIKESEKSAIEIQQLRNQIDSSNFGEDFSENYTAEQQQYILEKIKESGIEFQKLVDEGKTFDEILKEAGITAEELAAQLKETKIEEDDKVKPKASDFSQRKGSVKDEDIEAEMNDLSDYLDRNIEKINELDNSLKGCDEELDKIAYSMMRFDDALQDVQSNYDKWSKALNSDDIYAQQMAVQELTKTYGNLLDIDGSKLSDDFLSSAKNLELMNQVLNGTEEEATAAYNKLADLATIDYMVVHLGFAEEDAQAIVDRVNELKDSINYDDIKIGASIDDANLIAGLESILNSVDMTTTQAKALLADMGFDADVEQVEVPEEEKKRIIDLRPEVTDGPPLNIPVVAADGSVDYNTVPAPRLQYIPEPKDENATSSKMVSALKIKPGSLKKAATGSGGGHVKVHNSPARTGTTGKSGGGGGGGGGSSSPKKKTTKQPAKYKFEEDRYHNIKSAIDEVSRALERVDKLKERAYGKAKLKYMDQEIAKLKDQVRLQNEYIKEAETYLKMDRSKLEGLGMGAEFTDEGRLINYEQVLGNLVDTYNDAVDARNAAATAFNASEQEEADNEAFEAAEEQLKKAEDTYNEQKKILDQYEKTYNELQDQIDKRTDLLNQIYDAKLAKIVYKVDIQIEVNDADIKYLEWMNKFLERNLDNVSDIMANLSKAAQRTFKDIEAINQGITELFKEHNIDINFDNLNPDQLVKQLQDFMESEGLGSEITEAEAQQLRDWNDKLMQYADNWLEYWDKTHEMVDKVFKDRNEKIDDEMKKFDEYTDILENYMKVIDLTGSQLGVSDEDVLKIYDTKINVGKDQLESLRAQRDAVAATLQEAQLNLDNAQTEEAKQYWEKHVKEIKDKYDELNNEIRSQWETTLQWAQDRLEKALEAASKKFEDKFDNLTLLMERFERQQKADHLYLDDYEKYYELNKDAKELQKMINNTNNTMMKSKYSDYLDEINAMMASGVKLSSAQTDLIAKRVELLKAEDELLNARNAKNEVRMTRDDEGNFSYTYTANQDTIEDAEMGYNEAFYNLQKSTTDYIESEQSNMLNSLGDFKSQSQELLKQRESGQITKEQYEEAMAELEAQFEDYMAKYLDQMTFFYGQEATLRDEDLANLEEMTGMKIANYDDFITEYEDSILGRLFDDVNSEVEFVQLALDASAELLQENVAAGQQWEQDVASICESAGIDVDNFRETMLNDLADIDRKSGETKEKITEMSDKMKEDMDQVMEKALQMDREWAERMKSMCEQIANTVNALNTMLEKLADVAEGFGYTGQAAEYAAGKYAEARDAAYDAAKAFNEMEKAARAAEQAAKDALAAMQAVDNYSGSDPFHVTSIYDGSGQAQTWYQGSNGELMYDSRDRSPQREAGGYTGEWGSDGRVHILHEKEFVLNKEDTSNMFKAVDIVRGLTKNLDLNHGLSQIAQSIVGNAQLALAGIGSNQLDQNVYITADFPNVQNHNEIELAINNLVNTASQYVNRK